MGILNELKIELNEYKNILLGVCETTFSDEYSKYKTAIVIIRKYDEEIDNDTYSESEYHRILMKNKDKIEVIRHSVIEYLSKKNINYKVPQQSQIDEKELKAPFSFKFAAVNAGLGWIGKNGVLITKEFGPRIRITVVLADCSIDGERAERMDSLCGNCNMCKTACPYGAIKGNIWTINTLREELIDYQLCNYKRSEYKECIDRKHSCGYCILVCPWG